MTTDAVPLGRLSTLQDPSDKDIARKIDEIARLWKAGDLIVYLGADLYSESPEFPTEPAALAAILSKRVAVPGRLSGRLHEIAQYIESHKHRKTLLSLMEEIFRKKVTPSPVHRLVQAFPIPLVVDTWYSPESSELLVGPGDYQISGVSRAEYRDRWFRIDGRTSSGWDPVEDVSPGSRVLYRPLGTMDPGVEVLVSDADYVEVLTEIDIQTPIPKFVQEHRSGRHFLFLGCRFDNQTSRIFARQIMKRSSASHFVVRSGAVTSKEQLFYEREGIERLPLSLNESFLPELEKRLRRA
jgi:hypothetical protein